MVAVAMMTLVVAGWVATPGRAGPSGESSHRATHKTYADNGHIEIGHQSWPCLGAAVTCGGVSQGQFRDTCRIDKVFPDGTQGLDSHVFEIPKGFDAPGSKITVRGVAAAGIADVNVMFMHAYPQSGTCRASGVSSEDGDELDVLLPPATRWAIVSSGSYEQLGYDIDVTIEVTTPIRSRGHRD